MAKGRKVDIVRGYGTFLDPHHIEVEVTDGTGQDKTGAKKVVKFQKCIIAAGSAAMHLPFIPKDPRIVDSTGALEMRFVPKKMLVIGGGIIGLEMATVYSTLGSKVDVVEMMDGLMQGPDRDAVKVWEKQNAKRFDKIMLKTKTVAVDAKDDGLYVKFEGEGVAECRCRQVRHDPASRRPHAERQQDRCRQGRRRGHRPRLHQRRCPDAHQRAAHLRHRRPRRPAHARPQGGA
jgi:dihydrolipoamide dehydrogenase